jgi:hypothetical protein
LLQILETLGSGDTLGLDDPHRHAGKSVADRAATGSGLVESRSSEVGRVDGDDR